MGKKKNRNSVEEINGKFQGVECESCWKSRGVCQNFSAKKWKIPRKSW